MGNSSLRALVFAAIISVAPLAVIAAHADYLLIKTMSKKGDPVSSKIEVSVDNAAWTNIEGETSSGSTKVFVGKCDGSVRLKAYKRDRLGFYTREKPDDIRFCKTPEVVFNDYVRTAVGQLISPEQLGDPKAWESIFGSGTTAATRYADAFRDALGKGDYGYVAIATSELAASLRKAGSPKAAYPFETMALQSTMSGILQEKGVDPDDFPLLDTAPGTDRLTLTPKAQDLLVDYQKTVLGLSPTSKEIGKTGWTTMKSLAGGDEIKAAEWKLPIAEATHFDQSVFAPPPM
ncbi:hypothetical protein [Rhizobium laguerreae]|uniref:hypothetical protein n=1 Tax=Rhizobium laguerreae TaxID=1076926 RepID=UPI001C92851D|nr:hypothetical protein [Rhizobium laguerreae]MBY3352783.1 hypothetical protein [Rhizobium laguerreae]MBY3451775.1 hypothetical protein [Rhizobium laguerreae]MBY3458943.1 hypothetical protein [Rhizobium laguerreae]